MSEPEPTWENPTSEEIEELLRTARRIAVVGLSSDPGRPSNGVADYLLTHGYEIVPINPFEVEVLGRKAYPSLKDAPGPFDIVNVFRRSQHAPDIVAQAKQLGIKTVWLQEDVISPEAFAFGQAAGMTIIMDRCMLKEHLRLIENEKVRED